MSNVVFREAHQARLTLTTGASQGARKSLMQDPAMILIASLGLSFMMLLGATGWLLLGG
ncbi:MAG: hypothetical protein ACK4SX_14695 [Alcanivoracaceae bacterium]